MKKRGEEIKLHEIPITILDFLGSYNENMPASFPRATIVLLKKFKEKHPMLFKDGDLWSLDKHRKKFMDWLPQGSKIS